MLIVHICVILWDILVQKNLYHWPWYIKSFPRALVRSQFLLSLDKCYAAQNAQLPNHLPLLLFYCNALISCHGNCFCRSGHLKIRSKNHVYSNHSWTQHLWWLWQCKFCYFILRNYLTVQHSLLLIQARWIILFYCI